MIEPALLFIKNDQSVPFSQFLSNEKKPRDCTWKELSNLCGVNKISAYFNAQSKGEPESPPRDKFLKIIHALGYSESDFENKRKRNIGRRPSMNDYSYEVQLQRLGEYILQLNKGNLVKRAKPQKLSVPVIKEVCGDAFYLKYAKGISNKEKLYQAIVKLDPSFSNIELQYQPQQKKPKRKLEAFERKIIEHSLLVRVEDAKPSSNKNLPSGTHKYVLDELNKELEKRDLPIRTLPSVDWYIERIWKDYRKPEAHIRGSPSSKSVDQILEERLENIADNQSPDIKLVSKVLIGKDNYDHRKDMYQRYSHEGHTNLIIFLMEPDNYLKFISKDVHLFDIDFNEGEVEEALKDKYKQQIELLKAQQEEVPDETVIIEFIDSWLRCDMIFRKNGGGFVIVEVKQNAIDRPNGFKNATKACQQLSAYCAVILDNILRHNISTLRSKEFRPIKESVEGCLVAYKMDKSIEIYLNRAGDRRPIIIPKQIVDAYITGLHRKEKIIFT